MFLTDLKGMEYTQEMTTSVTLRRLRPRSSVTIAAGIASKSIRIGEEIKGHANQGEGCEESAEVHNELDWQVGLLDFRFCREALLKRRQCYCWEFP